MSKVVTNADWLLVEQYDKRKKRDDLGSPFAVAVVNNNYGVIKYSQQTEFPVGAEVYFDTKYSKITVEGAELYAMKPENVVAIVR